MTTAVLKKKKKGFLFTPFDRFLPHYLYLSCFKEVIEYIWG